MKPADRLFQNLPGRMLHKDSGGAKDVSAPGKIPVCRFDLFQDFETRGAQQSGQIRMKCMTASGTEERSAVVRDILPVAEIFL